ncbi:MAG: Molybdopterin adenylyltransferase [Syntrophomonadaceae bacterium]|nr:Molybdopterin adenylyltransferase [Bacillota bacterium]
MGKVLAVCISKKKGTSKNRVEEGILRKNYGLEGDAHAGGGSRQVSLLADETLKEMKKKGIKISCGGFGENLTTTKIEITSLLVGARLKVGKSALLEITQIGKTCQKPCKIYKSLGNCILPSQGVFAKVLSGGKVKKWDRITPGGGRKILAGVLTISDRCASGEREDKSGMLLRETLKALAAEVMLYKLISDDFGEIIKTLKNWSDSGIVNLILTTGGTGPSLRDVTPEATGEVLDKEMPGFAEIIRAEGAKKTVRAYLSRGVAGIRGKTLIVNLPGSPQGAKDSLEIISPILEHAIEVMEGKEEGTKKLKL